MNLETKSGDITLMVGLTGIWLDPRLPSGTGVNPMRGKGPRIERETIIRFDEASPNAEIWTASERFYRKLLKQGLVPKEDGERSAIFEVPKKCVVIRARRVLTDKQKDALRKHRFSSGKTAIIAGDNDRGGRSCWVTLSGTRGGGFT